MTTEVKAVSDNQTPSMGTRVAVTLGGTCPTVPTFLLAKALAEGKTVKEAWNGVKTTYKNVYDANREQFKENVHNAAEKVENMGNWKYLFGVTPTIIEKLDKELNE